MSKERRYDEKEIAAIFERASEAQKEAQSQLSQEGLTLAELQEIGAEAGLTPEFIAQAASAVAHAPSPQPRRRMLGVPVGVSREVPLSAPLTDESWERLVVDLRETFRAVGKVERHGSLRQWRNGNLKAVVEPTTQGQRLRLETRSERLSVQLGFGAAFFAMMLGFVLVVLLKDPVPIDKVMMLAMMSLIGAGAAGFAAFSAPRWARTRERQMEGIIERATHHATARLPSAEAQPSPLLDLDAVPDEEAVLHRHPLRTASERT